MTNSATINMCAHVPNEKSSKCCSTCTSYNMPGDTIVINIKQPCKLIMKIDSDAESQCDCSKCPQISGQSQKTPKEIAKERKPGE